MLKETAVSYSGQRHSCQDFAPPEKSIVFPARIAPFMNLSASFSKSENIFCRFPN